MFVKGIFLLLVGTACTYNIDIDFPIIFYQPTAKASDSYFGYTVYLHYEPINGTSWLIIGAPKGNYSWTSKPRLPSQIKPGIAYRCSINSGDCQEIKPEVVEDEEEYIAQLRMKVLIRKQQGWFGSAISIDQLNGILTVCAPRTIMTILNPFTGVNLETMQGICYSGSITSNALGLEHTALKFHDFKSPFWYHPLHGFSVHHASMKKNEDRKQTGMYRIVGEPKHESYGTVDIVYSNKRRIVELLISDELSQFGYSVESGYFFNANQLLFASGAPGWHYVGMVGIINPASNVSLVTKLHGTDIGEFFGASLAVGDLNNDGLDDLLIGAPYWGENNGKVYAYFGTSKDQFEAALTLQGGSEGGHFGYVLASGDLDLDGFDDIIVGAPWEDDGVIYIYNGGPDLKGSKLQISQRIAAKAFSESDRSEKMQRFGFSISKPVDIDGNGYLDIAVGAYKSQQAVILRSKPIVKTELVVETVPNTLQRDARQFLVKVCPKYSGYNMQRAQEFKITLTIDERHQRTKETVLELKSSNLTSETCVSAEVNISKNVRDFIEPIIIFAKHDFIYDNASSNFCEFCPVEKKNNELRNVQTLLPFNIGCGEDKVCNSNISVTATFYNVRDNDTWIIGSSDISLEVKLKNHGEPAYITTLEFTFPQGVVLRSILPSCQEDTSNENVMVICDTGNPIWEGEEKNIKLDLDMRHLHNASFDDRKLYFYAKINTRSINHGTTDLISILNLVSEVSLSLHGKANEEAYYLTTLNEVVPNITFQHTYQVYKLGASPIEDAQLIVRVPLSIKDSETLVHVYKPQLYVSGEYFECSTENTLLDTQLVEVQGEPSLDQIDISVFSDELQENGSHRIDKRDIEESILWTHNVENIRTPQVSDERPNDFIYINCTTPDVNCATIVCGLNALKTLQDIGKIVIRFVLEIDKLKDHFEENRVVLKFSTKANVEIIKPALRLHVNETRSTVEVVTMVYNAPKVEKLQIWIVMVSVLVGLLLLLIFAAILSTMGFFKRKGKQDLTNPENDVATENGTTTVIESENT